MDESVMRVRPTITTKERRRTGPSRRLHLMPRRDVAPPEPAPPLVDAPTDDHADERRVREAGGPIDRAQYSCTCGYVFHADVSTSVSCPNCGTGQAW